MAGKLATLQARVPMLGGNVGVATTPGWQDSRRASRHERGYGADWDKRRVRILKRDQYLCRCLDCKGGDIRVRPAHEVDHIVGKAEWQVEHGSLDGVDDDSNLQAINRDCHRKKTQGEQQRAYAAHRGGGSD